MTGIYVNQEENIASSANHALSSILIYITKLISSTLPVLVKEQIYHNLL